MKVLLNESKELYSGVFWITDINNPDKNYCFLIPTDKYGNHNASTKYELNAKSGGTYNHEKLWNQLPSSMTHNKSFNYYPRGRVQISNGKAIIYLNPTINTPDIQRFIIDNYNLTDYNGIKKIVFNSDGSEHYKCYLD